VHVQCEMDAKSVLVSMQECQQPRGYIRHAKHNDTHTHDTRTHT